MGQSELPRPPVYGTEGTLKKLALAYGGELWPELSTWARYRERHGQSRREGVEETVTQDEEVNPEGGTGIILSPYVL